MTTWRRAAALVSSTLILIMTMAVPSQAASSSGYRACGWADQVAMTTFTSSNLTHQHRYTSASGAVRPYSGVGTHFSSRSGWQQADWWASNGSAEPWEFSPNVVCSPRPV